MTAGTNQGSSDPSPREARVVTLGVVIGAPAEWPCLPAVVTSLDELARCHVVVAGDEAASALDPREVLRAAAMGSLLTCGAGHEPGPGVARWARACALPIVTSERLVDEVRAMLEPRSARLPVRLSEWCSIELEPGSAWWPFLAVLPALRRPFRAVEWQAALGLTRQKLHESCRSDLGVSPTTVLWWYVADQVRRMREAGLTLAEVARRLGFHDASALEHGWRRRFGCPPPPGGSRREEGSEVSDDRATGPGQF